jgi:hypothetical protein
VVTKKLYEVLAAFDVLTEGRSIPITLNPGQKFFVHEPPADPALIEVDLIMCEVPLADLRKSTRPT